MFKLIGDKTKLFVIATALTLPLLPSFLSFNAAKAISMIGVSEHDRTIDDIKTGYTDVVANSSERVFYNTSSSNDKNFGMVTENVNNSAIGAYLLFEPDMSASALAPSNDKYHVNVSAHSVRAVKTSLALSVSPNSKGYMTF